MVYIGGQEHSRLRTMDKDKYHKRTKGYIQVSHYHSTLLTYASDQLTRLVVADQLSGSSK